MAKFDKITSKKAAEKSIKEAEKRKEVDLTSFKTDFGTTPYPVFQTMDFSPEVFNVDTTISDSFFYPLRTRSEPDTEQKFKQVHEELADIRKYTKGLEEMVVSLTTVVTSLMHDRNRMKKQIKDQSDEFDEWFKKHSDVLIYVRNKIIEANKETRAIQEQNKNQNLDRFSQNK